MVDLTAALDFRDLTLGYGGEPALRHLTGSVTAGDLLAVCGPNGAGKSTLLKGVAGLLSPLSGSFSCSMGAHERAYLPQASSIDREMPIRVSDLVGMGLWRETGLLRGWGASRGRIAAALAAVGLENLGARLIGTLSGGQLQRALFARLLLQDARLILLDEPFAGVDAATAADLLMLIAAWHRQGRTVLAVLHDFAMVRRHFPHALLLAGRAIAWGPTAEVLSQAHLEAAQSLAAGREAARAA